MTRRAMLIGVQLAAAAAAAPPETVGKLTVNGWVAHKARTGRELRVLLDGRDVTHDCQLANDRKGFVVLLWRDGQGRTYVGPNGRPGRVVRGDVRIVETDGRD